MNERPLSREKTNHSKLLQETKTQVILLSIKNAARKTSQCSVNENQRKAKSLGYKLTKDQLKRWGLSYDKLIMGKPSYDLIVDDKSLFFNKNWIDALKIKINYNKY